MEPLRRPTGYKNISDLRNSLKSLTDHFGIPPVHITVGYVAQCPTGVDLTGAFSGGITVARWAISNRSKHRRSMASVEYHIVNGIGFSPDFSPVEKHKATLYGIKAVSPNSYAKGEEWPYENRVYNRTNGISACGASLCDRKI
jgi:hypothetical protein